MKTETYWAGPVPSTCDGCSASIAKVFYDMKSTAGPWGIFCPSCAMLGPGVGKTGPGLGQKYERITVTGRYLKTEG